MAQFDVFVHPVPAARRIYPFVVCLQSDLVGPGSDTVVAPLVPRASLAGAAGRLAPVVRIDDDYCVVVTGLTTLPTHDLSRRVANLARHRDNLLGAVDLLFYGV